MLFAIEGKVAALAEDGRTRYVWIDMFCASQNLLAGTFLPLDETAREQLKATDLIDYKARKEQTDRIFEDAFSFAGEILFASPPWTSGRAAARLPARREGRATRAASARAAISARGATWSRQDAAKGCKLYVVLGRRDVDGFENMLSDRWDEMDRIMSTVNARDAQVSKVEDREYILGQVNQLEGGLGAVTVMVCEALRDWLAAEGKAALDRMPADQRGTSELIMSLAIMLEDQAKYGEAELLYREALEVRRRVQGANHEWTLASMNNLGNLLRATGKLTRPSSFCARRSR